MEQDSNPSSIKSILCQKTEFWRKLCPDLSISPTGNEDADGLSSQQKKQAAAHKSTPVDESQRRRERLIEDGYVLIDDAIEDQRLVHRLAAAITTLHKKHALPATFALLFDETWQLAQAASENLSSSSHPTNKFNFDMLAWYIDPREDMVGFSPHRDRQPDDAKSSFFDDGMAKYVTMWLALTDATPENSCLYVIPKQFDPGYIEGDDDGDEGSDPLSRALPDKQAYQNIRALPRRAGQSLLFTHRILHWGSRGNPNSHIKTPRIAISFVSSDPAFERPYLDSSLLDNGMPPFKIRLLLVCAQLLIYYQRFDLSKECIKACHDYVKDHEDVLEETYKNKVYIEFIKAMREEDLAKSKAADSNSLDKNGSGSDEEDEAVLEAMLDAEAGGYGEFEDDYDDIDEEDDGAGGESGDEEDDFEDDDEPGIIFGKRQNHQNMKEDGSSKKAKS